MGGVGITSGGNSVYGTGPSEDQPTHAHRNRRERERKKRNYSEEGWKCSVSKQHVPKNVFLVELSAAGGSWAET